MLWKYQKDDFHAFKLNIYTGIQKCDSKRKRVTKRYNSLQSSPTFYFFTLKKQLKFSEL